MKAEYAAGTGSLLEKDRDNLECLIYCLVGLVLPNQHRVPVGHPCAEAQPEKASNAVCYASNLTD